MIRPQFASDPEILDLFRREASILHSFSKRCDRPLFRLLGRSAARARLSCDGVCRGAVAQETTGFRTASSRGGQNPAKARRIRAGGRARAWRRASGHFPRQSDHAGRRRSQRQGYRFRHRSGPARGRSDNPRRRVRWQVELCVPGTAGACGRRRHWQVGYLQFWLVLAEALLGRPIDMAGSQAEMVDKRRVVPAELAWIDPTMRPLLQAMLQPLPENRPSSMAEIAAWEPPAPTAARALSSSRRQRAQRPDAGFDRLLDCGRASAELLMSFATTSAGGPGHSRRRRQVPVRWRRPLRPPSYRRWHRKNYPRSLLRRARRRGQARHRRPRNRMLPAARDRSN